MDGKPLKLLDSFATVAFSPNGRYLAGGNANSQILLYNPFENFKLIKALEGHQ